MKAHSRTKAIPGRGAKGTQGKSQSKSKVEKLSATRPKASSANRPAAPGRGSAPQSSAPAGLTQKRGDKPPSNSQSRRDSKGRPATSSGRAAVRLPIVGIGASAGGLEASTHLLQNLPLDTGMGFVLVQHLDPAHASALTTLLARATSMPVHEVSNNMPVQPNHVYVIPPNTTMAIARGSLQLQPRQETSGAHRSIDFFFESLAQDQRERAIGVILSGTASDGTLGLEAIKAEAGITFAQDESAKYDSMPRSAIAAGCVDFVLSPENIAKELAHIAQHPYVAVGTPRPTDELEEAETPAPAGVRGRPRSETAAWEGEKNGLKKVLLLLRNHAAVDFSLYKVSTIQRRINRRMVLNKLTTLDAYARILRGNPKELDALYSDLLISVTSFFRNPEAFEVLKRTVFPAFMEEKRSGPIRVWVQGCSTGQEAYSLAMAFLESAAASGAPALQIFATDLNQVLLEKARAGLYTKSLVQDVSPERLRRFFVEEDGGYRICKPLRELIVFAKQNLLSDPPFSRIDLISCRNLLIYLESSLQKKVMPTFHYALKPKGFLFLGASESIGSFAELFEPVDKKHKIYVKKPYPTPALGLHFAPRHPATKKEIPAPKPLGALQDWPLETNAQREADRVALTRYAPASVLVNAEWQVLQFRGDTSPYLKPPTGQATFNVLKMAREGLMLALRAALNKAKQENRPVRRENVRVNQNGRSASLEVIPLKNLKERCYLIFFQETRHPGRGPATRDEQEATREGHDRGVLKSSTTVAGPPAPPEEKAGVRSELAAAHRRVAELEREKAETGDYVQSVQEQYEAANEEIQASNEEVTSANEELQSLNEELETSKEELESTNEELTTVNEEMTTRNIVLHQLNSDLANLQRSTHMAIVLLKRDLTIHRFSSEAEKLFNLLASDVGRPLSALRHNLELPDLKGVISEVIDSVREAEREVRDREGRWYSLRVRPYLSLENKVDGAVLILVDIDALKRTAQAISEARAYAEMVLRTVRDPLLVLNADLRVHSANQAFYNTFKVSPSETEGRLIFELGDGQWNIPKLHGLLEEIIHRNNFFNDFEVARDFERIGQRTFLVNARLLKDAEGKAKMILVGIQDVTVRKHAEAALAQAQKELQQHAQGLEKTVAERTAALRETVRELETFSYSISHDLRAPLRAMNNFAQVLCESHAAQLDATGRDYLERISASAARLDRLIQDVLNYTRVLRVPVPLTRVDLDKLVREIIQSYPDWQPPKVDIQIEGTLPPVLGHEGFLTQCVSNLLNNAIKFVAPGVQPRVRIWAEPRESHVRIIFQDNGVGIAAEDDTRIFRMFERIHPADEYEGTGIGLTIVRKAVERMGGKVDFESEPGQGSKFWLELRKSDPA